jgi:acyl-CoA synthetase (AMP-forming)/AMP-acid ligase II
MRVIDFFDKGVACGPDRICLQDASVTRTYREVQLKSYRIANVLAAEGFAPGQKAGIYTPNCVPAMEVMLGLFRAGVAWVPVNARNGVEENSYILDHNDAEILFYHSELEHLLPHLREHCPKIRRYVCLDRPGDGNPWLDDWVADAPETDPDLPLGPDSLLCIMSSGGTTGKPKGIVHTQQTWETMIATFYAHMDPGPDPVYLMVAPMTHAAGLLGYTLFVVGVRIVILPGFDATAVIDAIEREGVTHTFLPPTAVYMMLAQPDLEKRRFDSLRGFFYAAAPMSVDKLRQCLDIFGPVMVQCYGQVEVPMYCTLLTAEDHNVLGDPERERRLASCGRPTLLTRVAIMDDDGNLLPPGERGEIVIKSNLVMKGYYKNPEATAETSRFGWHHTGDIGVLDEDGFVYIVDRKKDMIISGGFNIYPGEVEQVLWTHAAIQDCAVIGVPDDKWGEAVKAVLELKPGHTIDPDEVIAYCKQRLGSIKTPKSVEVWESLPRSPVGKVLKKAIREVYWRNETRRI